MLFKVLTGILTVLLVGLSAYMLMSRRPTERFKLVDGYDGYVAFDTTTGQACRTYGGKADVSKLPSSDATVEFVLHLPPCRDIH